MLFAYFYVIDDSWLDDTNVKKCILFAFLYFVYILICFFQLNGL